MGTKKAKTSSRPQPPEELADEALLEWHRVCEELAAAQLLDRTDRAILTLYARTWAVWNAAARVVAVDGPVVLLPNNYPGESSEYKVMDKAGKQLDKLLDRLGLNPTARQKRHATNEGEDGDEDLDF